MEFHERADLRGAIFDQRAILGGERGGEVAVDIDFAHDLAVNKDRNDDFGLGLERAGEIARIGVDVVDHDGFAGGDRRAADTFVQEECECAASWRQQKVRERECWDRLCRACRSRPSCT